MKCGANLKRARVSARDGARKQTKAEHNTVAREPEQVFTSSCMAQPSEGTKHIHIKIKEQTEKN